MCEQETWRGQKFSQVWSFEFPYRVCLDKDKPRLGSILHPRYLDRGIPRTKPSSGARNLCQVLTGVGRSSESGLYISNTEILPFIQQHDIGHKTWANRDPDTTCKRFEKKSSKSMQSLFTESPSVSVSVAHCYAKSLYCSSSLSISQSRNHPQAKRRSDHWAKRNFLS